MDKLLEINDIRKLVDKNQDDNAELNSAIIMSAALLGLKASELALIEVSDLLTPKGALKKVWILREEIAFNGRARELYTEHNSLVEYLDLYLNHRVTNKQGVTNIGEYRGLNPESKVFLEPGTNKAFKFSAREAGKMNLQPVGINKYFKKLFLNAGMAGVTYKDFRRSLAIQMYREGLGKTGVIKDIMAYLGMRSYAALKKILNGDPKSLHDMIKGIYKRI